MRLAISGYRNFHDYLAFKNILDQYVIDEIIVGDATGADALARKYSLEELGKLATVHYADWDRYGNSAGPIRNGKILDDNPDLVIAFLHANSRGTKRMIEQAGSRGFQVIVVGI